MRAGVGRGFWPHSRATLKWAARILTGQNAAPCAFTFQLRDMPDAATVNPGSSKEYPIFVKASRDTASHDGGEQTSAGSPTSEPDCVPTDCPSGARSIPPGAPRSSPPLTPPTPTPTQSSFLLRPRPSQMRPTRTAHLQVPKQSALNTPLHRASVSRRAIRDVGLGLQLREGHAPRCCPTRQGVRSTRQNAIGRSTPKPNRPSARIL